MLITRGAIHQYHSKATVHLVTMPAWEILGCTVGDAAAIARNNMSAFWEDPTWILLWPEHVTKDFLIEQVTKRCPRNLLRDRAVNRHLKAVDPATGVLMGYARWEVPEAHELDESGQPAWVESQVPAVSVEEEEHFQKLAESAWWEIRSDMANMDDENVAIMNRIMAERPYISEQSTSFHHIHNSNGRESNYVQRT